MPYLDIEHATSIAEFGAGPLKLAIQLFLQYRNVGRIVAYELSTGRYNLGCEIAKLVVDELNKRQEDIRTAATTCAKSENVVVCASTTTAPFFTSSVTRETRSLASLSITSATPGSDSANGRDVGANGAALTKKMRSSCFRIADDGVSGSSTSGSSTASSGSQSRSRSCLGASKELSSDVSKTADTSSPIAFMLPPSITTAQLLSLPERRYKLREEAVGTATSCSSDVSRGGSIDIDRSNFVLHVVEEERPKETVAISMPTVGDPERKTKASSGHDEESIRHSNADGGDDGKARKLPSSTARPAVTLAGTGGNATASHAKHGKRRAISSPSTSYPNKTAKEQQQQQQQQLRENKETKQATALIEMARTSSKTRTIEYHHGNLFDARSAVRQSDIVICETELRKDLYKQTCDFFGQMKPGARLFTYSDISDAFAQAKIDFPFDKLDVPRVWTTWSPNHGHLFNAYRKKSYGAPASSANK